MEPSGGVNTAGPSATPGGQLLPATRTSENFDNRFTRFKPLARSVQYEVYSVFDEKNKRSMAIKLISREIYQSRQLQLDRELSNLWRLSCFSHPHILQLREVLLTPKQLGILMELVPGGLTLAKVQEEVASGSRKPLQTYESRHVFHQLMMALDFCHRQGIVHRDIRPDSILLERKVVRCNGEHNAATMEFNSYPADVVAHAATAAAAAEAENQMHDGSSTVVGRGKPDISDLRNSNVRLAGLGFSKSVIQGTPNTRGGMVLYIAPELYTMDMGEADMMGGDTMQYDGEAADVWSCGVVLFEMQYGGHPFISLHDVIDRRKLLRQLLSNSADGNLQLPDGAAEQQPELVALLRGMLNADPRHRFRTRHVLQSPWLVPCPPAGIADLSSEELQIVGRDMEMLSISIDDLDALSMLSDGTSPIDSKLPSICFNSTGMVSNHQEGFPAEAPPVDFISNSILYVDPSEPTHLMPDTFLDGNLQL